MFWNVLETAIIYLCMELLTYPERERYIRSAGYWRHTVDLNQYGQTISKSVFCLNFASTKPLPPPHVKLTFNLDDKKKWHKLISKKSNKIFDIQLNLILFGTLVSCEIKLIERYPLRKYNEFI